MIDLSQILFVYFPRRQLNLIAVAKNLRIVLSTPRASYLAPDRKMPPAPPPPLLPTVRYGAQASTKTSPTKKLTNKSLPWRWWCGWATLTTLQYRFTAKTIISHFCFYCCAAHRLAERGGGTVLQESTLCVPTPHPANLSCAPENTKRSRPAGARYLVIFFALALAYYTRAKR